MNVSEKSLELNVGAELLTIIRNDWGMRKAYLRGLTQREEHQEGVDFFVQLNPQSRIFAFQFKAPKGKVEATPYRYTLAREQHELLFNLSQLGPSSVFYVFPFYLTPAKLQRDVPLLARDTWLLNIANMPTLPVFETNMTKTIRCHAGRATVNPEYVLKKLADFPRPETVGISVQDFFQWYIMSMDQRERGDHVSRRRNPWIVRGLRVIIVPP